MNAHLALELRLAGVIAKLDTAAQRKMTLNELRPHFGRKGFAEALRHGVKRGLLRHWKHTYTYLGPPVNGFTVDAQAVVIAARTDDDMEILAYYGVPKPRLTEAERRANGTHHSALRQARIKAAFQESVYRNVVFERDNWTCQLCLTPVRRDVPSTHPLSPHVDHIIPVSRGGIHGYSNVQTAHAKCNERKGPRMPTEIYQPPTTLTKGYSEKTTYICKVCWTPVPIGTPCCEIPA